MDDAADAKYRERERRLIAQLKEIETVDLLPHVAEALKKMKPNQLKMARRMTLEELARLQIWTKEFYGW